MKPGRLRRVAWRARTLLELLQHLLRRRRYFFVPLVLVLLLAGALLLLSEGLSYVAPFVYTIF
ncbi:MAG: DUF5989 family protein [Myxococcales bacterium]